MGKTAVLKGEVITICLAALVALLCGHATALAGREQAYVGSRACAKCHQEQYQSYLSFSKKARSFENILKMKPKLTKAEYQKCFECHTTGFGKPGGFVSESATPHLKQPGCEVCHGPGGRHAKTQSVSDIKGAVTSRDCRDCHNPDRVEAFNYRPLIYGGGH